MELRGEIRGGRFVAGVAGEQYALPDAVAAMRRVREARNETPPFASKTLENSDNSTEDWIVISAADPLNLFGVITPERRVPAMANNCLLIARGRLLAIREAGTVEYLLETDGESAFCMRRALVRGRVMEEFDPSKFSGSDRAVSPLMG